VGVISGSSTPLALADFLAGPSIVYTVNLPGGICELFYRTSGDVGGTDWSPQPSLIDTSYQNAIAAPALINFGGQPVVTYAIDSAMQKLAIANSVFSPGWTHEDVAAADVTSTGGTSGLYAHGDLVHVLTADESHGTATSAARY
jgi:hypothetical protein